MIRKSTVVAILSTICIATAAWSAVIYTGISRREISVGDRVYFTVTILAPKGATAVPPDPASAFDPLVVKEWNNKKYPLTKADSLVFEYELTTYKPENSAIPRLNFVLDSGSHSDTLKTDSISITVVRLVRADSMDIMDLKPQQKAGNPSLLWLWLLIGGAVLVAVFFIVRSRFRPQRKGPTASPPRPPYEEAIEALAALEAKQYLMKGMVREYVFELSEIIKRYSERRFGVNAAEFTTEEMLAWLQVSNLDKEQRRPAEWFFRAADPVKFAKFLPEQDSIDRFGVEARSFLEATKPVVEPIKPVIAVVAPAAPETPKAGGGGS